MQSKPDKPDIITLLRNADEQSIRQRLDELNGESAALRTLLRAVRARKRAQQTTRSKGGRRD